MISNSNRCVILTYVSSHYWMIVLPLELKRQEERPQREYQNSGIHFFVGEGFLRNLITKI
jgi:hypothetical protein